MYFKEERVGGGKRNVFLGRGYGKHRRPPFDESFFQGKLKILN